MTEELKTRICAPPENLADALEQAARDFPDHGVLYLDGKGNTDSQPYPRLLDEAKRMLAGLREEGLQPGDKVLFQLPDNRDFVTAFWACELGGMIPVPLSIAPSYEQDNSVLSKLQNAWNMLERPITICSANLEDRLKNWASRVDLDGYRIVTADTLLNNEPAIETHTLKKDDLAILLLTSGSTGMPKAVQQTHGNLTSWATSFSRCSGLTPSDVSLNWMPLDHVGGIVMFSMRDVVLCANQIHTPTEPILQNPLLWLDWIEKFNVSNTWAPNFAYGLVNECEDEMQKRSWDLSSMRYMMNAGEAIVSKTARRFLKLMQPHKLREFAMKPAWGMSETCSATVHSHRFGHENTKDSDAFVIVGEPIDGIEIRVVDQMLNRVPNGKVGSLHIRGISVTPGYYNNPEVNQDAYSSDGWFITGDLAKIDDGQLSITGREKDLIIINGVNFHCHEIESAIESIKDVISSYTAATAIRRDGKDTDEIAIFFSPSESGGKRLASLKNEIRTTVAREQGIAPDFIIALDKEEIPKTAIGKIQRSKLRERFEKGEFDELSRKSSLLGQVWLPAPLEIASNLPANSHVLIFADSGGLAEKLAATLSYGYHECLLVRPGVKFSADSQSEIQIDPSCDDDYEKLFSELSKRSFKAERIVHVWAYSNTIDTPESEAEIRRVQERTSFSLLRLIQNWPINDSDDSMSRLLILSSHLHAVETNERVDWAKSPLLGISRTLVHEYSNLECVHLDLDESVSDETISIVVSELAAKSKGEFSIRGGERFRPALSEQPAPNPTRGSAFKKGGLYVLSGGTGGIAQVVALYLAKKYNAKLLLLGRAPLEPDDRKNQFLNEISKLGGQARYAAGRVQDPVFLEAAISDAIESWGQKPDGILHTAGSYREATVADESAEAMWEMVSPKLVGGWALNQVARKFDNCHFIFFSSVMGHFGGYSSAAYAASNASIDSLAFDRRSNGKQGVSVLWSMWEETGLGKATSSEFGAARGYKSLSPNLGLDLLEEAIISDQPKVFTGIETNHPAIRPHLANSNLGTDESSSGEYTAPRNEIESKVAAIWESILSKPKIGVHDNFFEIGGRSLIAAKLFARIEKELGYNLPIATLFAAPTIALLCEQFEQDSEPSSRILPIQADGENIPFFCIPGGGSDVIVFQDISQAMGDQFPFYGMQARGLDATVIEGDFPSVEEVAADFIQSIKKIQTKGPYCIGGHCLGCILAWEVAIQLKRQGDEVGLLALLDPIVSNVFSGEILGKDRLVYHWQKFYRMSFGEKLGYFWEKVFNFSRTLIVRRRISQSYEISQSMHERYNLGGYEGSAVVFMADDSFFKLKPENDPRRHYETLASDGVQYFDIPGDHHSILHDSGASSIASQLKKLIKPILGQPTENAPRI